MLLEQMSKRLHAQSSFEDTLDTVLNDAIALLGSELGNIQLAAGDRLLIAAQRRFKAPFLEFFREVHANTGSACGQAIRTGHTVVIEDTDKDTGSAPYRSVARQAGFRSVVSQPLHTHASVLIGVVSTHFVNVHLPTRIEIETLQSYSTLAADHLRSLLCGETLESKTLSLNRQLYDGVVDPI